MATSDKTALLTKDFEIIWLDNYIENVTQIDYLRRKIDLDNLFDHLKINNELAQCEQYILSLDNVDKVFLIVSGSIGETLLPSIHDHVQIVRIYVFCVDTHKHQQWVRRFCKIRGIFKEPKAMVDRLQRDIQLLLNYFTPVNIFTIQNVK